MDDNHFTNPFDNTEMNPIDPGNGDTSGRSLVWLLLGVIVIGCICLFGVALFYFQPNAETLYAQYFPSPTLTPSQTPTSTPTLTPTATSTPTPTPNMTATAQVQNAQSTAESAFSNWKVIRSDTFDSNKNKWLVEEASDDEYAVTTYEIVGGKYRWDATAHQSFIGWVRADKKLLEDFYLSVDIQQMEGPNTADYGVVFREDDDSNFYYFGITEQGEYVMYMFFEEWETLINFTETDLIQPGEVNRITVIGEGSHFTFFINDQYLTEITNDKISKGSTALAIEMADENDHGIFEFDNFELRAP